jgi:hypothetical protein
MLAALALVLAAVVPTKVWLAMPAVCPSRWVGLRCPGCGMVRALSLLMHGHPRDAWAMNPRVALVAPVLVGMSLQWLLQVRRGGRTRGCC